MNGKTNGTSTGIDLSKLTLKELLALEEQVAEARRQASLAAIRLQTGRKKTDLEFYESLDWTKSNMDLSRQTGVPSFTIRTWRFKLGKDQVRRTKYWPACKNWDWSLSNTAIARLERASVRAVAEYRFILNKPLAPRDYIPRPEYKTLPKPNFEHLDWENKCDVELAKEAGVTRERIRQIRATLGKPRRLFHQLKFERFTKAFDGVKELSWKEARPKIQIGHKTFIDYCIRLGIKIKKEKGGWPKKHPWHLMDWRLPNLLLGRIWGIGNYKVAAHRCNHCLPSAEFVYIMGNYPEKWEKAIKDQRQAASTWNKSKVCESSELGQV